MTGTLSRIDYTRMARQDAAATYRRRQRTMRIRYSADADFEATHIEELYSAMDEVDDEDLIRYLSMRAERRKKRNYAGSTGPTSREFPNGDIGDDSTNPNGSTGPERYFRALSDKALHYCKKRLQAGEHVDYAEVLERFRAGFLK